jgi:hypothetical protein
VSTLRGWSRAPTLRGLAAAGASLLPIGAVSVLLLIPAVFFVIPLSPDVDALTLCLPGVGPVHRFGENLEEREEVVFLHERVHAEQCRQFGAAWYAKQAATRRGRLALEAEALCAEVKVLSLRGEDRERLIDRTVDALESEYFPDGDVTRGDVSAAVDWACGSHSAD